MTTPPPNPDYGAEIRDLTARANEKAKQHILMLIGAMGDAIHLAEVIADGGDAYPVGIREIASRMTRELGGHNLNIVALMDRRA